MKLLAAILFACTLTASAQVVPFRYSTAITNGLWRIECSTNGVHWTAIMRNCYGTPQGELCVTNRGGMMLFRARKQRGYEAD